MALRSQDPLPDWITHVAHIEGQNIHALKISQYTPVMPSSSATDRKAVDSTSDPEVKELVSMKGVNVRYHERHVSSSCLTVPVNLF